MSTNDYNQPAHWRLDRTFPMWGIVAMIVTLLAVPLVSQVVLSWANERERLLETRYLTAQIQGLSNKVEALGVQLAAKDNKDVAQEFQIADLMRRVLIIENFRRLNP